MVTSWRTLLLGARWLVLAALALTAVIWIALAWQYAVVSQAVEDGLSAQVRAEAELVAGFIAVGGERERLTALRLPRERRVTLIGVDGTVLYDSLGDPARMDNHNSRPEVVEARRSGSGVDRRVSDSVALPLIYAARLMSDGRVVRVAAPIAVETTLEARLLRPMAAAAVAVLTVGALIIGLHLWRDRTRVAELVAVARAYANGQFARRAGLLGADVLAHLGHELNAMGEKLQHGQQDLARQRSLLDAALGALSEGVACIDHLDQVLYANSAWRQLAASGGEALGQPYYEHLPVLHPPGPGEDPAGSEFEHRRRHLRALMIPVDADLRVIVVHDLTELKRLEGARRDFIAAVSHELKTPLTSISGFAETLLDGVIDEDPAVTREFVGKIARHADRLAELVRDVLTLSRLEQGAWEIRPLDTDVVRLGRTILDEYARVAERQQVKLELDAPEALAAHTDPELVRQLAGNLVSNAVRYNRPEGTVWLRLAPGDGDTLRIIVQDTGIGIPAEHRERIFDRFYRVDAHRSRANGGTGLGLAIVRQLVDVLGGTIAVASGSGGTTFTVTLPRRDPRAGLARKPAGRRDSAGS
jgi:two-component system phosphate regulon sensor histidine kinase PhoR